MTVPTPRGSAPQGSSPQEFPSEPHTPPPPREPEDDGGDDGGSEGPENRRGRRKVAEMDQETFRKYARRTGWLLLVLILAYIGLQLPLPYRLLAVVAGLAGVVGGVVLFIQCLRGRLPAAMHISAVAAVICCGMFTLTSSAQVIFWESTAEFDHCRATALTERSMNQCYADYEQNMFDSVPGMP